MSRPSSRGFTLIEALIAVLVLSLGLLGVAAMQLKAVQSAHLSYHRSIATLAAQDVVERLWVELGEAPPNCPDASLVNGTGTESWHAEWINHLPNLSSTPVAKVGCEYTITVDWDDARFSGENVSQLIYIVRLPGE
ncbi:type IV pilus modification protein PilV [Halomonas sp. C05BenzN]|uniref:type IV pilus modification protein PilV n=1 Tax=Halomonas sp. C05BenzN TaxID=3411041 RepID=UPI003B95A0A7